MAWSPSPNCCCTTGGRGGRARRGALLIKYHDIGASCCQSAATWSGSGEYAGSDATAYRTFHHLQNPPVDGSEKQSGSAAHRAAFGSIASSVSQQECKHTT